MLKALLKKPSGDLHCHQCGNSEQSSSRRNKPDYFLWTCACLIAGAYLAGVFNLDFARVEWVNQTCRSVFDLVNTMWWGVGLGLIMLALLSRIPREFISSALGTGGNVQSILRATFAGVLLDLCSHGILMVGAKLYERGASIGQVMAFLIASPWNSFSLTMILFALIGIPFTLLFIVLSMAIAIFTGILFQVCVARQKLPNNPNTVVADENIQFFAEARRQFQSVQWSSSLLLSMIKSGLRDSRMVMRWLFFGVLLASLIRALVDIDVFSNYFGPTLAGLGLTMLAATIIEVCSEGSTPIAGDLVTRANAPGNGFAFLMTGVATDYTEVMVLKETTQSVKIALCLPFFTVPQVMVMAWLLNHSYL